MQKPAQLTIKNKPPNSNLDLPIDLYVIIFQSLPYIEYPKIARSCQKFNLVLQKEFLWQQLCTLYSLVPIESDARVCFQNHIQNYWKWDSSSTKSLTTLMKYPHSKGYPATNPLDRLHNYFTIDSTQLNKSYYGPLIGLVNKGVYESKGNFEKGSVMLKSKNIGSKYMIDHNCREVDLEQEFLVRDHDRIKFKLNSDNHTI